MTVTMAARQKKRRRGLSPPEVEGGEVCVVSLMAAAPFPDGALENVSRRRKVSAGLGNHLCPPGKVRESSVLDAAQRHRGSREGAPVRVSPSRAGTTEQREPLVSLVPGP